LFRLLPLEMQPSRPRQFVSQSAGVYFAYSEEYPQNVAGFQVKGAAMKTCLLSILLVAFSATMAGQKQTEGRLPYAAIHDPQFIPASSATFLHDPDRVIGVVTGRMAKAYPAAILSQHGLVEDQSPSGPIAITW
jgi:Protein of unknown function (DUF3179)